MDKCDDNSNNNYVINMSNCDNVQIGHGNTLNYGENTGNTWDKYEEDAEQPNVMYDLKSEEYDMTPFVGRQTEREKIKTELTTGKRRFVQLYGQTKVGKSRLAQQVAVHADNLLVNSFSSEALDFYQTMASVTERFGTDREVAILRAKLGRVLTVTTGADMDRALSLFKQALKVLKNTGASKVLISLFQDIGYNHYKCGKYQKSVRYCTKALDTAKDLEIDSEVTNQVIAIRSTLAIPNIFLEQGLEYLEEGYRICKRLDSMHYNTALTLWHMGRVNMLLNNLERACELLNESLDIFNVCAKYHGVHMHVRLVLCHCYVALKNMTEARNCLKESLSFSNYFIDQTPKHEHYLLALGHLIMLVQSDKRFMKDIVKKFIQEASRLITVCGESKKSPFFNRLLVSAEQYLQTLRSKRTTDVDFLAEIDNVCFVCTDMNKVGYKRNYFWQEVSLLAGKEAELRDMLVNSSAVQTATCLIDHHNQHNSPKKRNVILSQFEHSDKAEFKS